MKLAVVAANGKSGRLIVKEAVARGLDVTAVVRGENKTESSAYFEEGYHGSHKRRSGRF